MSGRWEKFKNDFENTRTGRRTAGSVTSGNTGWRAHGIVFDDPLDSGNATSKAERDTVNHWWTVTMAARSRMTSSTTPRNSSTNQSGATNGLTVG